MSRQAKALRIMYALILLTVCSELGLEVDVGDVWRSIGFALALVCLIAIRADLTSEPTS